MYIGLPIPVTLLTIPYYGIHISIITTTASMQ
jgi:hypothetical protein